MFSLTRFFRFFKLNLTTNAFSLGLTFIIYFAIMLLINLWIQSSLSKAVASHDLSSVPIPLIITIVFFVIFMISTPIITTIIASRCAKAYHKRASAAPLLMLPASKTEQFSVLYLLYVVLIPTIFYIGTCTFEYYYIQQTMNAISSLSDTTGIQSDTKSFTEFSSSVFDIVINPKLFLSILLSQSLFFLGGVFFKSYNYIKTVICFVIFTSVMSMINTYFSDLSEFTNMESLTKTTAADYIVNIAAILIFSTLACVVFRRKVLV